MDNIRGAVLMIIAMAGFAIEDMFIKLMADSVPVGQILIMTGVGGGLIYGAFAVARGLPPIRLSMLRGASGLRVLFESIASLGFVAALALVPVSVVTTIIQASPLLVTMGASLFLGQQVGWRRWTAIFVGLFGVLIVLRPFGAGFDLAALLAVMGVIAMSARDLVTRQVRQSISTVQLSTLGFLSTIPAGLLALGVTGDNLVVPDTRAWLMLAGILISGVPALYCIIAAMRAGDIAFIAPFRYARIVFGLLVGFFVFRETLDFYTLLGAAIIVASGLYTFVREAQSRRRASLSPQPAV